MRIAVLDTGPCESSLGGKRFQGLTAIASTGGSVGERAVIASLIVVWGATRLSSSRVDGLGRGFQRICEVLGRRAEQAGSRRRRRVR
ncbi:hypothetical protein JCM18909_3002 [Cutibacterium acnes JCM 18909]|nr:hypothetical protein JCM18909_3002 [Cutibacterium acnes JCM 18909]